MSGIEFVPREQTPTPPAGADPQPVVERAQPRRRLLLRSLTSRLTAGVVALVVVLVLAISAATYFALRSFLLDRLDQQLGPIASQNERILSQCVVFQAPCQVTSPPHSYRAATTEWVMVLDQQGNDLVDVTPSESLQPLQLSAKARHALAADPPDTTTLTTSDGQHLRVSAESLPLPDGRRIVVLSGLSTSELDRTLGRLIVIELIIGASAVLLAFVATSWGVRRSLRNLYRVTGTAKEVAAELSPTGAGLDRRVDVPDDGTEVGQLAESMNTLLAAVETQFAARLHSEDRLRQFVADASHELRTPLTSIRGYAELARMQKAAGANADDNLARIESEGTRMSRLVDDLLMLARGDQSRAPRLELIDVAELLDDAVNSARAATPTRPIDVEHTAGLNVVGDRDQLYRVVSNLIGNANMHTAAGRPVLVRCSGGRSEVVIQVIDGGPGLPPEEAAHVFERFWRADKARSRARGGTGLGLSIVAAIVAAHGGTVRFDSTVEQGSTVTVRLPAVDT